jgi:hypothetical protein
MIEVDETTAQVLEADAAAQGVSVAERVAELVASSHEDEDWSESLRRLAEYDRTGEYVTLEEALAHFDDAIQGVTQGAAKPKA